MKNKTKKNKMTGKALLSIVLLLVVALVVFVSCKSFGFGFGSGKGSGSESGENAQQVMATVSETTSTMTTMNMEYVDITVHENSYIFNSDVYDLDNIDALIKILEEDVSNYTVKITDDNASAKAYSQLITAFDENKIKYIEVSE